MIRTTQRQIAAIDGKMDNLLDISVKSRLYQDALDTLLARRQSLIERLEQLESADPMRQLEQARAQQLALRDALRDATAARRDCSRVTELDPSNYDARLVQGVYDYAVGSLPLTWRVMGFLAGFHGDKDRGMQTVEEARKFRPHQLSEPEERVLTDFSPVGNSAWTRLFEELCAGIRVHMDGTELALEEALTMLREPDRELRRNASHAITGALNHDIRTRGYIFNVILQEKAIDDRLRHFPSWISSRNLANETSDEAVRALVEAVTGRYDVCVRYYRVKKRLLGVGDLHEWDRYAPISDTSRNLTWDDAKELALGSYARFPQRSPASLVDFSPTKPIHAPVVPGKTGGGYCMGVTPDHHPYILLNFTGKLRDALVLAHELGHGLHDRLATKQNIFDYHPPLTLAETASVFGEQLTFDRIMAEEKDPKTKLALLCGQVEDAFSTVFRQVAFNRYEDACHTARRTEGELSVDQLSEIYQAKLQPMFGDALILTDEHKVWWSDVGHFLHTPGYVYAYAFGNLLAMSVYHRYLEKGPGFVEEYLNFLSAGGSTRPDELVKSIGMDITDPGFWSAGLKILDGMVTEVERLAGK